MAAHYLLEDPGKLTGMLHKFVTLIADPFFPQLKEGILKFRPQVCPFPMSPCSASQLAWSIRGLAKERHRTIRLKGKREKGTT